MLTAYPASGVVLPPLLLLLLLPPEEPPDPDILLTAFWKVDLTLLYPYPPLGRLMDIVDGGAAGEDATPLPSPIEMCRERRGTNPDVM